MSNSGDPQVSCCNVQIKLPTLKELKVFDKGTDVNVHMYALFLVLPMVLQQQSSLASPVTSAKKDDVTHKV